MDKRLEECLAGRQGNYVLPFFWQHGESEQELKEEIDAIYRSGAGAFCVESRTHEQFCEDGWWETFGIILREAKARGMKVWLLDDKHFPTGYANGLIAKKYPQRRKWHLIERHLDVMGPARGAILVRTDGDAGAGAERTLLAAVAYRRVEADGELLMGEPVDLTRFVKGDLLCWEVPEGCFRVFLLFKTREGGILPDYISTIDPASVDVLIEAVYEPHYRHYADEFGKTFAGFFSDEPCFGNGIVESFGANPGFYEHKIGTPCLALPWRDDVPGLLERKLGRPAVGLLPLLWYSAGERTAAVRVAYMDVITTLYRDCFSNRLGAWCREHGVEYIGHVVEDMNCHTHMGAGAGHYFRSLDGQDMSGIDVVFQQIMPGFARYPHASPEAGGMADPLCFDYMIGKLAASLAHINPRMRGRAMCEMYGAFGWAEGTPMMKWLTDHMLVRGVNHFVPHAFSPRYPDPDCPPHFYMKGHNPQFPEFSLLMEYANKMAHLLSGGRHVASAAVLYHAEAEWAGEPGFLYTQQPARELYDHQLDYDILPSDTLLKDAQVEDGKLVVQLESYPCLIVPYAKRLPAALLHRLSELSRDGLCVVFVGGFPEGSLDGENVSDELRGANMVELPLQELTTFIRGRGFGDVQFEPAAPLLRVYHTVRDGSDVFMFLNESSGEISGTAALPVTGKYLIPDFLNCRCYSGKSAHGKVELFLERGESRVLVFSDGGRESPTLCCRWKNETEVDKFDVELADLDNLGHYLSWKKGMPPLDVTGTGGLPDFSGLIRYRGTFEVRDRHERRLLLKGVGETARVWVNGTFCGDRFCRPYTFDITEAVLDGENELTIVVANSLAYRLRDGYSRFLLLPPSGLTESAIIQIAW